MANLKVVSASTRKSLEERLEREKRDLTQQLEVNRSNVKDLTDYTDVENGHSNHRADVASTTERQAALRT